MGVVKRSGNWNSMGPFNKEAAKRGSTTYTPSTRPLWFLCQCIHHLGARSRSSDSLQKQRAQPAKEERYPPLSTATRNQRIPKPEGEKKKGLKTNTPAPAYATLSTFSALHQIGNKPLFLSTGIQR